MSDEVVKESSQPAPLSASSALRKDVSEQLASLGGRIREMVVAKLVETEIEERKGAVLSVLGKIEARQRELKKAEGEGKEGLRFDLAGQIVGQASFTKVQLETISKLKEQIEKLQKALEEAFSKGDFKKVKELAANN